MAPAKSSASATEPPVTASASASASVATPPETERTPCPEAKANILSRIFLAWVLPLITLGWRTPLQDHHLWELRDHERGTTTVNLVLQQWNSPRSTTTTPTTTTTTTSSQSDAIWLQTCLLRAFRRSFLISGFLKAIDVVLYVIQPIFIDGIIRYLRDETAPVSRGYAWAFGIFIVPAIKVLIENAYFTVTMRTGMKIRSALQGVLYDKSLKLSPAARASASLGEIVNLMQLDSQRIGDSAQLMHVIWAAPIQIIVTVALLIRYIGWSAIIGFMFTLLTLPLQAFLFKSELVIRKKTLEITDKRVKLMNEIVQGVKAVKFYAWEKPFARNVTKHREEEVMQYRKVVYIRSMIVTILFAFPVTVGVITFAFYTGVFKQVLDPAKIFTGIALLNQLRIPIMMFPNTITGTIDARLGLKRIERLLNLENTENYSRGKKDVDGSSSSVNVNDDDDDEMKQGSESGMTTTTATATTTATDKGFVSIRDGEFEWSQIAGNPLHIEKKKRKAKSNNKCLPMRKKKNAHIDGNDDGEKNNETVAVQVDLTKQQEVEEESSDDQKYVSTQGSVLRDINVHFSSGQLHAVVGQVGSGKSSLFHAILGEMRKVHGHVKLQGTVAYVAQTAWIFHDTLRSNILFGKPFNQEKYDMAIEVSALEQDIKILPAGDLTSIGERGVNLSGGQKQRVSIARAVYAQADVYLFDDPLSALDAHVSQHVFERCISNKGLLKDKLRILITNQVHVLPMCDNVVFLNEGTVMGQGSFDDLAKSSEAFNQLVSEQQNAAKGQQDKDDEDESFAAAEQQQHQQEENMDKDEGGNDDDDSDDDAAKDTDKFKAGVKMMQEEERRTGQVGFKVYRDYIKELCGIPMFLLLLFYFFISTGLSFIVNWWLSYWSAEEQRARDDPTFTARSTGFFLSIYFSITLAFTLMTYTRSVWLLTLALRASKNLHNRMLKSLLHAPLSFFDTTPVGRVLSRFSMDISALDEKLPTFLHQTINTILGLILTYVFVATILPPFIGVAFPMLLVYFAIMYFFKRTLVELKRLDAISKSPIYANFSETLGGLSTLRAYGKEDESRESNMEKIDINQRAFFSWMISNRLFTICLESCGSLLILAAALIGVAAKGSTYAGDIGLALTYTLQVTSFLGFAVRSVTELEGQMSSVERANYYVKQLPQEADTDIDGATPKGWPADGAIQFENVQLRYREGLPLVLKGINMQINAGEKVGIVGRTGSGKSSMMIALLRMVELYGGRILIDGIDVSTLGLDDVRSQITIIPQDPVMFSGTIRLNLDPLGTHTDMQLWDALEKSHMKQFVAAFDEGLDAPVSEYGENLSAGQRQIICLTRALLRDTKVLILDEASSSLDNETDGLVQETIRKHLRHATILTIAHRLLTLADYDRVVVLENGHVAQFGTPKDLLEQTDGVFVGLVDSMGHSGAAHFRSKVLASQGMSV